MSLSVTLLFVEPDPNLRSSFVKELKRCDWVGEILEAENLEEAVSQQTLSDIDLLITSDQLPDGRGVSLIPPHPSYPILFLIDEDSCQLGANLIKLGAREVFVKSQVSAQLFPCICKATYDDWNLEKKGLAGKFFAEDFWTLLNCIPCELFIIDQRSLQIVHANPRACIQLGVSLEDIRDQSPQNLMKEGDFQCLESQMESLQKEEASQTPFQLTLLRKDGSSYPVDAYLGSGYFLKQLCYVVTCIDRTRLEILEEKQASLREQLNQSQKLEVVGRLSGGIAHDFNNMLTPIIGYAEMALEDGPPPSLRDDLTEILKGAHRAQDLVRQILTFSGKTQEAIEPVCLQSLISEVREFLRRTLPPNIRIQIQLESDCGEVLGDSSQLRQLILNLCTIMTRTLKDSNSDLVIRLRSITRDDSLKSLLPKKDTEEWACIEVESSTFHLPKEIENFISDPTSDLDESQKGAKAELSVIQGILQQHKGAIQVKKRAQEGGYFSIYLPIFRSSSSSLPQQRSMQIHPGRERLLIVDDEEAILGVWSRSLPSVGYQLTLIKDPSEALELFSSDPNAFDVVITDQTMPKMKGDELSERIRELRSDIPIILITGYSDSLQSKDTGEMSIDEFLIKPVSPHRLTETIRHILKNDELAKESSKK